MTSGGEQFQTSDLPNGVGGATPQLGIVESGAGSTLLGSLAFTNVPNTTAQVAQLTSYSAAVASQIVSDLNSGTKFRLVITAGDSSVGADLEGVSSSANFIKFDPSLSINVDETFSAQVVKFDAPSYSVDEADGQAQITVDRLAGPNNDTSGILTVPYSTGGGTAGAGTNYTSTSGTLTFTSGVTSMPIDVPIADIQPQGGNKTFNVTLGTPTLSGDAGVTAVIATPNPIPVTIEDNDESFNFSSSSYSVNETSGTAFVSVIRSGFTGDAASVEYYTTDNNAVSGTDYGGTPQSSPGTVSFSAGQSVATIAISLDDATGEQP